MHTADFFCEGEDIDISVPSTPNFFFGGEPVSLSPGIDTHEFRTIKTINVGPVQDDATPGRANIVTTLVPMFPHGTQTSLIYYEL